MTYVPGSNQQAQLSLNRWKNKRKFDVEIKNVEKTYNIIINKTKNNLGLKTL